MNRWGARLLGIILLLVFMLMFAHMQRTLRTLQQQQQSAPAPRR
jgi:putative copper export protein